MISRMINLPFKVLGAVSRKLQERNDAAVEAKYGKGTETDDYSEMDDRDRLGEKLPEDWSPGNVEQDAARLLADQRAGKTLMLVDVRKPAEFARAHIPGALSMPLGTVHIRLAELPPDLRIVLYCDDGRRSANAASFVRFRGIEHAWSMTGGLAAWKKAGGTVEGGTS